MTCLQIGSSMKNKERNCPGNDKEKKNTLQLKKVFLFVVLIAISKLNLKLFTLNVDIWLSVVYILLVLNSVRAIYTNIITNSTSWKYRVLTDPFFLVLLEQNLIVLHRAIIQINESGASSPLIHFSACLLFRLRQEVKTHSRTEIIVIHSEIVRFLFFFINLNFDVLLTS